MTRLEAALIRLSVDLGRLRCRWALVGGLAVSARARPRTTDDLDVAVAVSSDQEAEHLISTLRGVGYEVREIVEQTARGRLATVRLVRPPDEPESIPSEDEVETLVDLLFASSGIEPEIVSHADRMTISPGLEVPVATTGHLLAMKVLAEQGNRPQDLADSMALIEYADAHEIQRAKEALELIVRRGFDRGKDLRAALARILAMRRDLG